MKAKFAASPDQESLDSSSERRTQILKGALDLCALAVLSTESTYGYGLVERLREHGLSLVAEGTVYPLLTRLEKRGLLTSERVKSKGGPPRKYYSITAEGLDVLSVGRQDWKQTASEVSALLDSAPKRS